VPIWNCQRHQYPIQTDLDGWVTTCGHTLPDGATCPQRRPHVKSSLTYEDQCETCWALCADDTCGKPHVRGDGFCIDHTCQCYGGPVLLDTCAHEDIQRYKDFWWCQGFRCQTCPVSKRFLACYFMLALGTDSPVVEAVHTYITEDKLRHDILFW
jgi:hypothetical protein